MTFPRILRIASDVCELAAIATLAANVELAACVSLLAVAALLYCWSEIASARAVIRDYAEHIAFLETENDHLVDVILAGTKIRGKA